MAQENARKTLEIFLARADARPLTALHACWYLALSRLPANFLPEVAGVQFAFRMLGTDDLLLGSHPALPLEALTALLAEFAELATPADRSVSSARCS